MASPKDSYYFGVAISPLFISFEKCLIPIKPKRHRGHKGGIFAHLEVDNNSGHFFYFLSSVFFVPLWLYN